MVKSRRQEYFKKEDEVCLPLRNVAKLSYLESD